MKKWLKSSIASMDGGSYAKDYQGMDLSGFLDCSNGINPFGVPDGVRRLLVDIDPALIQHYPHSSEPMKQAIAAHWKDQAELRPEQILLGDGTIELIYKLNKLFLSEGSRVLGLCPQFPDYINDVRSCGGNYASYDLAGEDGYRFDAAHFMEQMDSSYSIYYLDNPNNPTGQFIPRGDVERIVRKARDLEALVIVDEAYGDFLPLAESAVGLLADYEDLIVLRTFSKGLGLAGLRAGYALTSAEVAGYYRRIANPYEMSGISRLLCQAALADEAFMARSIEGVRTNKKQVQGSLTKLQPLASHPAVPILTVIHPDPAVDLEELFFEENILTVSGRSFAGLGRNAVRLMIHADIQRLTEGIRKVEARLP